MSILSLNTKYFVSFKSETVGTEIILHHHHHLNDRTLSDQDLTKERSSEVEEELNLVLTPYTEEFCKERLPENVPNILNH